MLIHVSLSIYSTSFPFVTVVVHVLTADPLEWFIVFHRYIHVGPSMWSHDLLNSPGQSTLHRKLIIDPRSADRCPSVLGVLVDLLRSE